MARAIYMYAARPLQWWFFKPTFVYVTTATSGSMSAVNGDGRGLVMTSAAAHQFPVASASPPPPPPAEILEIRASKAAVAAELVAARTNLGLYVLRIFC